MEKKTGFGKEQDYVRRTEGGLRAHRADRCGGRCDPKEDGPQHRTPGEKQSPLRIFAGQLGDLMTMILLVCAGLSVLMGEGTEALAMMAIVLVNALIGFLQEYRTERTLEALTRLAAPTARVIRQGIRRGIPGRGAGSR